MKLKAQNILSPLEVEILGDEAWLEGIYQSFPQWTEEARLTASLRFIPYVADSFFDSDEQQKKSHQKHPQPSRRQPLLIRLQGRILFRPWVDCSRCEVPIPWPIDQEVDVMFTESLEGAEQDADESHYPIQNGEIDLELLLNDVIQLAVPIRRVAHSEKIDECLHCGRSLESVKVFSSDSQGASSSPFAVLKNLKVK